MSSPAQHSSSPPLAQPLYHAHSQPHPQQPPPSASQLPDAQPHPFLSPSTSRQHRPEVDPFPIQLHLHRSLSRVPSQHHSLHRPLTRDDGLDNIPPPLPGSPLALARRLTGDPDLERQMGVNDENVGPPPEGGREAWSVVISAFLVLFSIFGFVTSFGQLKVYYLANQLSEYSQSDVAWIGTVQTFMTFAGSIFMGRYFDSHGARLLTITATILSFGALVGLAFCKEYYQFFLAHLLFGFSGTVIYSPATAIAGHWFMRRRSTAVGIVVCGAGAGGVVYPVALKKLFEQLSFRDSILIIAGISGALMLPAWFFLKARLPPRHPPPFSALKGPWKEARYTCLVAGSWMVMLNLFTPYFNAPVLATGNNLSSELSSYSIAILQAGSFLGRAASGYLADLFGVWTVFVCSIIGCSISIYAFWVPPDINAATAVVGMVAYGLFSGAWFGLVAASCGAISPTREFGMRLGMLWSTTSIAALAGPVICGLLITNSGGKFEHAGLFVASTHLLGAFLTVAPRVVDVVVEGWRRIRGKAPSRSPAEEEKEAVSSAS
ncbi:hypothetical protein IAT38_000669 [Cryptococcus sp. DSM 104549]